MEQRDERDLNVYTDGSSRPAPRRGGIGIRFVTVDTSGYEQVADYPLPGFEGASNQQMEIMAVIEALKALVHRRVPLELEPWRRVVIWTDSMFVVEGYGSARFTWPGNGWRTREGNPVVHAQLWRELIRLADRTGKRVEVRWVKGHKTSAHNKAADRLASQSAERRVGQRASVVKLRRKKSERSVERGSVRMLGQRATIRIISDEYLPAQKMNRYRYEVMSRRSPFYRCVDWLFAEPAVPPMSAGHTYRVRFNDDTASPRVTRVFAEVE